MKILVILGAGSSLESWIPTFRWKWKWRIDNNIFHKNFFLKNKNYCIEKYKELESIFCNNNKNNYHKFLDNLDQNHELIILSQNIDNLDKNYSNVLKIHWEFNNRKCLNNYKHKVEHKNIWERCNICNSYIIPNIVLYWEKYKEDHLIKMKKLQEDMYDFFIIIWTELEIYPIFKFSNSIRSNFYININPTKEFNFTENYKNLDQFINEKWFLL